MYDRRIRAIEMLNEWLADNTHVNTIAVRRIREIRGVLADGVPEKRPGACEICGKASTCACGEMP